MVHVGLARPLAAAALTVLAASVAAEEAASPGVEKILPRCPYNQEWVPCLSCQSTCQTPATKSCDSKGCLEGCGCADGFYLDENTGYCVKPLECGIVCPKNQIKKQCHGCQNTCQDKTLSQVCDCDQSVGCGCEDGMFLDTKSGFCVSELQCHAECPYNQVLTRCSSCQNTCKRPENALTCKCDGSVGCGCPDGLLMHPTGICVKEPKCKKECPNNLKMVQKCCENTCTDPFLSSRCTCPQDAPKRCGCPKDMFLHNGRCVTADRCKNVRKRMCPRNQIWTFKTCDEKPCFSTCEYPEREKLCQNDNCLINGEGSCGCEDGKHLINDRCVTENRCQAKLDRRCLNNQIFVPCAACQSTCEDHDSLIMCHGNQQCGYGHGAGCGCATGLVLNRETNQCVSPKECPSTIV
mmetsp:Transcript_3256/g.6203  ORF Transcript_3256/g.6203 Transcript_3256/m.6203 type:complete len:408 (-) Transcript_3256:27-1250(-)